MSTQQNLSIDLHFSLFPNPSNNFIFINNYNSIIEINYAINNIMGQQFSSGKLNSEITKIDINQLPSGQYILTTDRIGNEYFIVKE